MKHNEHEVEVFKQRMKKLGVDDISVINACVRNTEQAAKFLPHDKKYWFSALCNLCSKQECDS